MVDWASQDRLYSTGYLADDIRYRSIGIDSSLPYSISLNKRHSCRLPSKQLSKENILIKDLYNHLNQSVHFFNNNNNNNNNNDNTKINKIPKLLATYISNINCPRSVCCLSENDGSLIVCEQDRCRLLLFSSHLMLRSTCGGNRGDGYYEFDSPWNVSTLFNNLILVADTNNRRIQFFNLDYHGKFIYKYTLLTKEKPYYIATNKQHFAVSCEKGFINTYLAEERTSIGNIDLNRILGLERKIKFQLIQIAYCLCMDIENSFLFVSNPIALTSIIYQLTINGEYLRSIKLDQQPFLHISSLTFDSRNGQLIIIDSLNSIIYSVEHDLDDDNVEILLKRSDNLNYPQALCISNEGHLVVVECSILTQHALKIFRHHSCVCHSRMMTSSVKTSETTSVRSMIFQY